VQAGQVYTTDFDGSMLTNGVYLYRVTSDDEVLVERFIVTK
jgi:hypothetical protein